MVKLRCHLPGVNISLGVKALSNCTQSSPKRRMFYHGEALPLGQLCPTAYAR
jgi:hypothetical protein